MLWNKSKRKKSLDIDARFLLANERTLLAWVRTGLALIGGGVAVGVLTVSHPDSALVGFGAVAMGGVFNFIGYLRYRAADVAIRSGELPPTGIAGLLIVIGTTSFAAALLLFVQFYR